MGTSSRDEAYALTTGLDGSIYVGGTTYGYLNEQTESPPTNSGVAYTFLTKYRPDGVKVWTRIMGTSD